VLISPEAVKPHWGLAGFNVTLTREQVRHSPEIDPERTPSRQDEERLLGHFGHPLYWKAAGSSGSTPHLCSTKEVTGDHIQASDGEIGHVDDFLIDEATWHVDYLVVDTSNWIGGKRVLISPMSLTDIDWPNSKLLVAHPRRGEAQSVDRVGADCAGRRRSALYYHVSEAHRYAKRTFLARDPLGEGGSSSKVTWLPSPSWSKRSAALR
jgi:PRC-barrel domain protein